MSLKMGTSKKVAISKSKKKEANARRKLAKRWDIVSNGIAYKKASVKEFSRRTTLLIEEELFDGIILDLETELEDGFMENMLLFNNCLTLLLSL